MRNLEMRLRLGEAEWRLYPLARHGRWVACWDRWHRRGAGLVASCTREIDWEAARILVAQVATMDDAAFQSWHARTLAAENSSIVAVLPARSSSQGRAGGPSQMA